MLPSEADDPIGRAIRDGDAAALVRLYVAEADRLEAGGEIDAACFFLTQAYVWALDGALEEAPGLRARLIAAGREG